MNDDIMGKAYDARLMKRLLKYARPYWKLFFVCIILLVAVTGLELLNPYLLKVAIDDYINGNSKPIYELELSSPYEGVEFNGHKYVRQDSLDIETQELLKDYPLKKILRDGRNHYIEDFEHDEVISGVLIDDISYELFRKDDIKGINRISLLFLIVIVFTFVFNYLQVYILNYTSQKIIFNIRDEIFNHIQSLSISYFDKNPNRQTRNQGNK